jgi:oxalate decarboxylase/phosphoglucose isomerase-like protein (cupin superfamily)
VIVRHVDASFSDDRGTIIDILEAEPVDSATIIHSNSGAVRGNHVHRETYQWVYVLSGAFDFVVVDVEGECHRGVVRMQDVLMTGPNEAHAMQALEQSTMLVLTRGPRGGRDYETDTFRLDEPLIEIGS